MKLLFSLNGRIFYPRSSFRSLYIPFSAEAHFYPSIYFYFSRFLITFYCILGLCSKNWVLKIVQGIAALWLTQISCFLKSKEVSETLRLQNKFPARAWYISMTFYVFFMSLSRAVGLVENSSSQGHWQFVLIGVSFHCHIELTALRLNTCWKLYKTFSIINSVF